MNKNHIVTFDTVEHAVLCFTKTTKSILAKRPDYCPACGELIGHDDETVDVGNVLCPEFPNRRGDD